MSCEKNRGAFVAHVAGAGSPAAQAFGGTDDASAAIETIFDTARRQSASGSPAQQQLAAAKTRLLFEWMRRSGFHPPTHSASGLPKPDAQFGYAAVFDTLTALRDARPLPALAAQIVESFGQTRALTAIRADDVLGRLRCGSCGQFAPADGSARPAHLCPTTTTPERLQRALIRRLGVPLSAYPLSDLAGLLDAARAGGVRMQHPITRETVQASLDSLPLALTQGFVPSDWGATATLVEVSHGRIAPVLCASGLTPITLPAHALEAAATASGTPLPAATPLVSPAPPRAAAGMVGAPAGAPPTVSGGSAYWLSRFLGTEYRKGKGQIVEAGGRTYTVGERSRERADWGRARHSGTVAPPPSRPPFDGIAVGRTLVAASEILRVGTQLRRTDGVVEVYDAEGGLLALYDPATRTAGDVEGTANASAAQLAAVLAARLDGAWSDLDHALGEDMSDLRAGVGTALAVADSAYLTLKAELEAGNTLMLGGTLTASRCGRCGRYMGAGSCRARHEEDATSAEEAATSAEEDISSVEATASASPTERSAEATGAASVAERSVERSATPSGRVVTPVAVTVRVDAPQLHVDAPQVTVDAPQVTVQVDAPHITVQVDADELARRVAARVPVATDATHTPAALPFAPLDARMIAALDGLLTRLERLDDRAPRGATTSTSSSAAPPSPPTERTLTPRADRPVPPVAAMTPQEQIVSRLRLPRPDRALAAIDPKLLPSDFAALDEDIPPVNPTYALNAPARLILQRIVSTRAMGVTMGRVNETRAFGIYGPPGTGKNELARQLAAALITTDAEGVERQGVHLEQVEFDRDMDIGALIGTTALDQGSTVARLGPVGLAAVQGSVICLNEVVRNPKALTAFQSMLEEGEIRLKTPEAGIVKIPLHPATTFVLTWNPGLEGDADRPAEAPRSRIVAFELPPPTVREQAERVSAFFANAPSTVQPHSAEVNAAIALFNQVRSGIVQGKLQQRGRGSKAVPGPRDLNQFLLAGKTDGWTSALEQLRVFCDQNAEDRDKDWTFIREQFATTFGADGNAVSRTLRGSAPART